MYLIVKIVDDMNNIEISLGTLGRRISGHKMQTLIVVCILGIQFSLMVSYIVWIISFLS